MTSSKFDGRDPMLIALSRICATGKELLHVITATSPQSDEQSRSSSNNRRPSDSTAVLYKQTDAVRRSLSRCKGKEGQA